jgi:hypothetical protein
MENALATVQRDNALLDMSGDSSEMAMRLANMQNKLSLVKNFFQSVMDKDIDFGTIPGTDKPTLYKPGAEKLCELYGYSPIVKVKKETRDPKTGYYLAEVTMQIIHRTTGMIIAEGVGEASTYESKYRYRWLYESKVPKEVDKDSLVKQTFTSQDKKSEYVKYRIDNADLIDQWNTVLKMAKKRALVDAVLSATRSSGIFSQSESEMEAWIEDENGDRPKKLQKKRDNPHASDRKETFDPPTGDANKISQAQYGKIIGDAKRKGVDEAGIKDIVRYVKHKDMNDLTKGEASAMMTYIAKTADTDLQDLVLESNLGPGPNGEQQ